MCTWTSLIKSKAVLATSIQAILYTICFKCSKSQSLLTAHVSDRTEHPSHYSTYQGFMQDSWFGGGKL